MGNHSNCDGAVANVSLVGKRGIQCHTTRVQVVIPRFEAFCTLQHIGKMEDLIKEWRLPLGTQEGSAIITHVSLLAMGWQSRINVVVSPFPVRQKEPLIKYSRHNEMNSEGLENVLKVKSHNGAVPELGNQPTECIEFV